MLELATFLNTNFAQNSVLASLIQMKTLSDCSGLVQSLSAVSDDESAAFIECVATIALNDAAAPAHHIAAFSKDVKDMLLEIATEEGLPKFQKLFSSFTDARSSKDALSIIRFVYALADTPHVDQYSEFIQSALTTLEQNNGDVEKTITALKEVRKNQPPVVLLLSYQIALLQMRGGAHSIRHDLFTSLIRQLNLSEVSIKILEDSEEENKKLNDEFIKLTEKMEADIKEFEKEQLKDKNEEEVAVLVLQKRVELMNDISKAARSVMEKSNSIYSNASDSIVKQSAAEKSDVVALNLSKRAIGACEKIKKTSTDLMAKYAKASKNSVMEKNIDAYKKVCSQQNEVTAYLQKVYKAINKNDEKIDLDKVDINQFNTDDNLAILKKEAPVTGDEIKSLYKVLLKNIMLNSGFQLSLADPEYVLTDNLEGKTAEGFESEFPSSPSTPPSSPSSDSKPWLWIVLAVIGVAAIGGGAYYFMSKKKKKNTLMN